MNTENKTENNKPVNFTESFQFTRNDSDFPDKEIYTCSPSNKIMRVVVSWKTGSVGYSQREVEECLASGHWKILTNENTDVGNLQDDAMKKLEDYIKAIHKSVPEDVTENCEGCTFCECPECKEAFAQESEGCFDCDSTPETCDCGAYIETPVEYQETLLEAIKSFTQNTSSTVFMVDGEYEVYCLGLDSPFKAAKDDEMWKLIEAVEMLEGAM